MKSALTASICTAIHAASSISRSETNNNLDLCQGIAKAKASLWDGIRQPARSEAPISAKFDEVRFLCKGKITESKYDRFTGSKL